MIVKVISGLEEEDRKSRLQIKGMSKKLDFLEGDADCYIIQDLIKEANELGLKGEKIEFEEIEDDNIYSDNYS